MEYVVGIIGSNAGHLDVSQLITGYEHSCKRPYEFDEFEPDEHVPDELVPDLQNSCIELPEIARNQLLFSQISEMAHEKDIVSLQTRMYLILLLLVYLHIPNQDLISSCIILNIIMPT